MRHPKPTVPPSPAGLALAEDRLAAPRDTEVVWIVYQPARGRTGGLADLADDNNHKCRVCWQELPDHGRRNGRPFVTCPPPAPCRLAWARLRQGKEAKPRETRALLGRYITHGAHLPPRLVARLLELLEDAFGFHEQQVIIKRHGYAGPVSSEEVRPGALVIKLRPVDGPSDPKLCGHQSLCDPDCGHADLPQSFLAPMRPAANAYSNGRPGGESPDAAWTNYWRQGS
jgi:hypothetical protein